MPRAIELGGLPAEVRFANWDKHQAQRTPNFVRIWAGILYDAKIVPPGYEVECARGVLLTGITIAGQSQGKVSTTSWLSQVSRRRRAILFLKHWLDNGLLISGSTQVGSTFGNAVSPFGSQTQGSRANGNGAAHESQSEAPRAPAPTPPVAPQLAVTLARAPTTGRIATLAAVAGVAQATTVRVRRDDYRRGLAGFAFAYWAARTGHSAAVLDPKREARILARLTETDGDLNDLLYAVDGLLRDEFLMGRTARSSKKYDGIEVVFRDRGKVEELAGSVPAWNQKIPHPKLAEIPGLEAAS